jgi:hypothetical protein
MRMACGAHIVKSVEPHFDLHAISHAMRFAFEPAADARGEPVVATLPWTFVVSL